MNRALQRLIWLGCAVLAAAAQAQLGGIRGNVNDLDFEVPLPGVKVRVSETGQETESDAGGGFYLEGIVPGAYTLLFSKSGYTRLTRPNVVVSPGQLAEADVALAGEYEEMDELVVRDIQLGGASEIGLLNLRMESTALMDSVGADLMSQAGASDAAQALALVPGTTVQDGKYAVVRGLPDRYVSTQMNGVRLPTADVNKRAVQLDQFPAAMIESIQVSKTFTPDQQGDASGGAVNVILKGIPDRRVLKGGFGLEFNSGVMEAGDQFLTYDGGGVGTWGMEAGSRTPQPSGTSWSGAVGVSRGDAPQSYKWGVTAGDQFTFDSGIKVGAVGSFFYKKDASYYTGVEDAYWVTKPGAAMTPQHTPMQEDTWYTALYDTEKGTEEVKWGAVGGVGIEYDEQSITLLYSMTRTATDSAVLQDNTRGKYWVDPAYDISDPDPGEIGASPFTRLQTLEYVERDTDTLQLRGNHVIPLPDWHAGSFLAVLDPELDWTVASSGSSMDSPDKRQFAAAWTPSYVTPGYPQFGIPPTTNNATYYKYTESANVNLGNLQRIWKTVEEESDQYFINGRLPFEQWSGDEGFVKIGLFHDEVYRTYRQDSYSNSKETYPTYEADWSEFWSEAWPSQTHDMYASTYDIGYDGEQTIDAWYYMLDIPVWSALKLNGGARYEHTEISTRVKADVYGENGPRWYPAPNYSSTILQPGAADVDLRQDDVLPALGFEYYLTDRWTLRGSYSETVARPTFKELTPVEQQEYLGGDIFIGNPDLQLAALQNYDLRVDFNPYPGGLLSASWFHKDIDQPIEYVQQLFGSFVGTTAVNYDEGQMDGFELEARQSLDRFWDTLRGVSVGANFTYIDSSVQIPGSERSQIALYGFPDRAERDMLNAPEYLYNLNATWNLEHYGTEFGLFYSVKGDTLVAGAGISDNSLVPDVYEKERGALNFTASRKLGNHLKLAFKAKNLTNPEIETVYRSPYTGVTVKQSYRKGIDYSVELTGTW